MIPSPKKIQIGDTLVHCSLFDTGITYTLNYKDFHKRMRDTSLVLPPVFVSKCKDLINTHIEAICSWFNPSPSKDTIANVTYLPSTIPCDPSSHKSKGSVQLSVKGIIVEHNRILPHITLDFIPDNLTQSLTSVTDDIKEITDEIMLQDGDDITGWNLDNKRERYFSEDEDEDEDEDGDEDGDGDGDDDRDGDDDEDEDDRFARVQRNLDEAREELERLRRNRYRG